VWVPGKIALAAMACATAALAACSGPLDSPTPRPRVVRDAGPDHLVRDVRPDRGSDVADRGPSLPDLAPEVIVDKPVTVDAGIDAPGWPVVPGCVLGLPPNPLVQITREANPLVVGCAGLTRTVATLLDSSRSGFIFTAAFDPPLDGFYVSPAQGVVCADGQGVPLTVVASELSMRHPGSSGNASVRINIPGPIPLSFPIVFPYSVVSTEFTVVNETIDFGLVPIGAARTTEVVFSNLRTSPAIQTMYTIPQVQDPFSFGTSGVMRPFSLPLEPGQTGPLLTAYFDSSSVGTFAGTFVVSPFPPGMPLDPGCAGLTHFVTLRGQVYMPRGSGPIP